jgi:hypothetical protein
MHLSKLPMLHTQENSLSPDRRNLFLCKKTYFRSLWATLQPNVETTSWNVLIAARSRPLLGYLQYAGLSNLLSLVLPCGRLWSWSSNGIFGRQGTTLFSMAPTYSLLGGFWISTFGARSLKLMTIRISFVRNTIGSLYVRANCMFFFSYVFLKYQKSTLVSALNFLSLTDIH